LGAAAAFAHVVELLLKRFGLLASALGGQVLDDGFEVLALEFERRAMVGMEGQEFAEEVIAGLTTGVGKELSAGDHGEGEAGEDFDDLDADPAGVTALAGPELAAGAEVVVAEDEVVSGLHQDGPEAVIGPAA